MLAVLVEIGGGGGRGGGREGGGSLVLAAVTRSFFALVHRRFSVVHAVSLTWFERSLEDSH